MTAVLDYVSGDGINTRRLDFTKTKTDAALLDAPLTGRSRHRANEMGQLILQFEVAPEGDQRTAWRDARVEDLTTTGSTADERRRERARSTPMPGANL